MNYFIAVQLIIMFTSVVNDVCNKSWWELQFNRISNPDMLDKISSGLKFMLWIMATDGKPEYIEIKLNEQLPVINRFIFIHKPLKITIHSISTTEMKEHRIRRAYLKRLNEFNVISVDWSTFAYGKTFGTTVQNALRVGIEIGYLLKYLVDQLFVSADNIHIIGIHLGSHVAGSSGRAFAKLTDKKIGRITALDPPVISVKANDCVTKRKLLRLNRDDAKFVDVIYTSRKSVIAMKRDIGHANFLPNNGGPTQPFCELLQNPILEKKCTQSMAVAYYLESVKKKNSFKSVFCPSKKEYKAGNCKKNFTSNMGHDADPTKHGRFYLTTNAKKPYSRPLSESLNTMRAHWKIAQNVLYE